MNTQAYTVVPGTIEAQPVEQDNWSMFPGRRRANPLAAAQPPKNTVLIPTGGNALQAVPQQSMAQESNLISVTVPQGMNPGDKLMVKTPDGTGMIQATIPPNVYPGHTFFVRPPKEGAMPLPTAQATTNNNGGMCGMFEPLQPPGSNNLPVASPISDPYVSEQKPPAQQPQQPYAATVMDSPAPANDLILVQVPPGSAPGSKLRVQVPDGRLVEAVVPSGNVTQFYMRVPPEAAPSWQNAPVAPAPTPVVAPVRPFSLALE